MKLITVIALSALLIYAPVTGSQRTRPFPRRINQPDQDGYTPLMRAAERGQVNAVRALLKRGAEVDARHPAGITALMFAARKGCLQVVKLLLAAGADPNVSVATPDVGEVNPLIWGILSRNKEVVKTLLKAGAKVNPWTAGGGTPLLLAVESGAGVEVIKTLLAAGADVNARTSNGYTALMA